MQSAHLLYVVIPVADNGCVGSGWGRGPRVGSNGSAWTLVGSEATVPAFIDFRRNGDNVRVEIRGGLISGGIAREARAAHTLLSAVIPCDVNLAGRALLVADVRNGKFPLAFVAARWVCAISLDFHRCFGRFGRVGRSWVRWRSAGHWVNRGITHATAYGRDILIALAVFVILTGGGNRA
jgi:hypothetical protein